MSKETLFSPQPSFSRFGRGQTLRDLPSALGLTKTFKSSLPRYLAMMGVYMVCLTVLKVVEYFVMVSVGHGGGKILVNALVYNLISASWVGLGIGVLYF